MLLHVAKKNMFNGPVERTVADAPKRRSVRRKPESKRRGIDAAPRSNDASTASGMPLTGVEQSTECLPH
jgi:hypothetical protein